MVSTKMCRGYAFRIAVGITTLVLLTVSGTEALSDRNILLQNDINNSFIVHRMDAGITPGRDLGMPFGNATGELAKEEFTSKGVKAESHYGRIPETKNLLSARSIEMAAVMIQAQADWFINDNATGGDCISIGTWNAVSNTCTLTTDLTKTIEIDSDSITLDGNGHTITGSSSMYGIFLSGRSGVTIMNTNIMSFYTGIYLYNSNNNTLSDNNALNNENGIELYLSGNNTLSGNNALNNYYGIYLYDSGNNTLVNNTMTENSFNFGLNGWSDSDFNNQIDYSNTVDGKPIYYIKNENNTVYDSSTNAGIVYCISCLNVTLKDIELLKNEVGILFRNTTSSKVQNVTVSNNRDGIVLLESGNNTLMDNTVNSNDYDGIYLDSSGNNTLDGNNASNNSYGIYLTDSRNNTLSSNNASNNSHGIYLYDSGKNMLIYNTMTENSFNFGLDGGSDSDFINQIDFSNTVDGKTIYYIINAKNTVYDSSTNTGTFYCIICLNVTLKDIELLKNEVGILFRNTTNSKIQNVTVSNNEVGIELYLSDNNTLGANNASKNYDGIVLLESGNNTLNGNNASNNDIGIILLESGNSTLSGNNASNNYDGIVLLESGYSTLSGNNASNNDVGIVLLGSGNDTLGGNNVSNNYDGIILLESENNTLSGNNASDNSYGIYLEYSSKNILFNNTMTENSFNFGLYGWSFSDFNNQIDYSNTVDGKPIFYIKNAKNTVYDSSTNAGIFYCISCLNVTIKDIEVIKNDVAILFWNTTISKIQNVTVSNNDDGIVLLESRNNTLHDNNVNSNDEDGIYLDYSSNNTLSGNNVNSNHDDGIVLYDSGNNTLSGNNANLNDDDGIYLGYSHNNILIGNNASNNNDGIYLDYSTNNMLFSNTMTENSFNFGLYGWSDSDFNNQIDYSNTVDGKPIYYIKNAENTVYDSSANAGIFYCISCLNVTINDLELLKNRVGIIFRNTTFSKIQNVTVLNNYYGIVLMDSDNNTLNRNNASNNDDGIYLYNSSNNTLNGNNVNSNNYDGINLYSSSKNNIIYNNVFNNSNNFDIENSVSIWNIDKTPGTNIIGGSYLGGNFWANPSGTGFSQTCTDADSDGICDSGYVLDCNNIDYRPLSIIETIVQLPIDPATGQVNTTITQLSGNVTITIPNGTVAVDATGNSLTNISINTSVSFTTNATLTLAVNDGVTGHAIELKPEGARFDPPIRIRFNYSLPLPGGVGEESLTVRYFNNTLNGWEVMDTVERNTAQHYIIANISHFSTFALIGTKPISSGGGSSSDGTYPPGYGTAGTTKTPSPTVTSVATATPVSQSPEVPAQTVKPEVTVITTTTPAPTAKSSGFGAIIAVFGIAMIASLLKKNRSRR